MLCSDGDEEGVGVVRVKEGVCTVRVMRCDGGECLLVR